MCSGLICLCFLLSLLFQSITCDLIKPRQNTGIVDTLIHQRQQTESLSKDLILRSSRKQVDFALIISCIGKTDE